MSLMSVINENSVQFFFDKRDLFIFLSDKIRIVEERCIIKKKLAYYHFETVIWLSAVIPVGFF